MERKNWVKPMTLVQKFEANEAVAATSCFQIVCQHNSSWKNALTHKCNAPLGYMWTQEEGVGPLHSWVSPFGHDGDCHNNPENNVFRSDDGTSLTFLLQYNKGDVLGGGLDHYEDANHNGVVDTNDIVYWHTDGKQGAVDTTWNHWGYVTTTDPDHPLRS